MTSTAWKDLERTTAKALGGTRNSRGGDFGKSAPDVEHSLFTIETKYRKTLPVFLTRGIAQARSYSKTKTPLLVLKERGKKDTLVVMSLKDFVDYLGELQPVPE